MFGGMRGDGSLTREKGAPVGLRIQRRISRMVEDDHPSEPPPAVPQDCCSSSSSDDDSDKTRKTEIRVATLRKDKRERAEPPERTSYVEEPPSTTTTLDRRKEKMEEKMERERALVRRITNEMQIAHFIQRENAHLSGAFSSGVYQIRSLRYTESLLRKALWKLGKTIANRRLLFILITLLVALAPALGTFINRENLSIPSPLSLLLPSGRSVSNGLSGVRPLPIFNHSNAAFNALDFTDPLTFAVLMYTNSPKDNILRRDAAMAYTALKKKIDDFPEGKKEYLEVCSVDCEIERDMVDRIVKKSSQVALTFPETFVSMSRDSSNLSRVYLGSTIGGVDVDSDGAISRAQSLLMKFKLRDDLTADQMAAWARNFEEQVAQTSAPNVSFLKWSPVAFTDSVHDGFSQVHIWLLVPAVLLLFVCFFAGFGSNAYQSKPLVGLAIGVALLISCLGGLGTQFSFVQSFDPLIWAVFFPVLGVGLVWFLQLHRSWKKFSFAAVHPKEKIAFILAHDGPGYLIASAIIVLSFVLLAISTRSSHMSATFFALAAAVLLVIIFALLFLTVFIYMGGRREAKGVKWYQLFKTGDTHFTAPNLTEFESSSLFSLHDRLLDSRPSLSRTVAARLIASRMRYPIVFICTVYLIVAFLGCLNAKVEIKEEFFLSSSVQASRFVDNYNMMFGKTTEYLEIIVDQPVDYHDQAISDTIDELMEKAIASGYAARAVSWMSEFQKFSKNSIYDVNDDTFVPVVNLVFLVTEPYKRFGADIVFDRFQTQIVRSRMYLELTQKGFNERAELTEQLLTMAHEARLPLAIRAPFTPSLHHDIQAVSEVLQMLGVLMVALFLFSILLFGQPAMSILLLCTSGLVIAECIGFSVFWGVPLNVVTFTMIVAGNSLSCVVVMAFCYSYSVSGKGQMRAVSRMQYTFQTTLFPVTMACILPTLLYLPLLLLDIPIVMHMWKVLVLNSTACLIHYFLFLPNLLRFFSEHFPSCKSLSCSEICCETEDDNSIYYIPTTGRSVHPERPYCHKSIHGAPPNYLAITGAQSSSPYIVEYGITERKEQKRPTRPESSAKQSTPSTPQSRRHHSQPPRADDASSIYEAPPSPKETPRSHHRHHHPRSQSSPRRGRDIHSRGGGFFDEPQMWRPYAPQQPQPFVFYPSYR